MQNGLIILIKHKAWNTVAYALSRGYITKQPCEVCGALKVQAHHDDYFKPLEVRWLCQTHHTERHNHPTTGP